MMKTIRFRLVVVGLSMLMLVGPIAASAEDRVTFGDVSSAFQAFWNGFSLDSQDIPAAPADGYWRGRLAALGENGQVFCENDWILASFVVFLPKGSGRDSINRVDVLPTFANTDVQFEVDSRDLSELVTPLKVGRQLVGDESRLVWFQHYGSFIEPYSLAVGTHILSTEVYLSTGQFPVFPLVINFTILDSAHAYCVQ